MKADIGEGEWIDRFVIELAPLGARLEPEALVFMARELWPYLGGLDPESVARADWEDGERPSICERRTDQRGG